MKVFRSSRTDTEVDEVIERAHVAEQKMYLDMGKFGITLNVDVKK